jgi:predicted transposase YbfD/YdcC
VAVDEKSNEITAIPKLPDLLDVSGCLVTIDAAGCQTDAAAKVRERGGDDVLAPKGNQPALHRAVIDRFRAGVETDFAGLAYDWHTATETGHGRTDGRADVRSPDGGGRAPGPGPVGGFEIDYLCHPDQPAGGPGDE